MLCLSRSSQPTICTSRSAAWQLLGMPRAELADFAQTFCISRSVGLASGEVKKHGAANTAARASIGGPGGISFPGKSSNWWTWRPLISRHFLYPTTTCQSQRSLAAPSSKRDTFESLQPCGSEWTAQAFFSIRSVFDLLKPCAVNVKSLVCSSHLFDSMMCLAGSSHLFQFHSTCIHTVARETTGQQAVLQTKRNWWHV